jgi:hypothetical protein
VSKFELPRQADRESLDFGRLISTLNLIDGECVVVRLSTREEPEGDRSPGVASIVGDLRQVPARYQGHEFSIGTPYAERYPEHLAGGVLFLNEGTFRSATLTTFDGNDYFIISIQTRSMHILVQDSDSTAP